MPANSTSKTKAYTFLVPLFLLVILSFTACSGSASLPNKPAVTPTGTNVADYNTPSEGSASPSNKPIVAPTATIVADHEASSEETAFRAEAGQAGDKLPATPAAELSGISTGETGRPAALVSNRQIIKNAELALLVEDTDTTINRSLGIITEYSGYVISNRTWFKGDLKYATLAIGVPVDNFEEMLRRLKDLAVTVTNETASGQDVTDQFVDLESRLRNLEATAARIREFLDQAKDVKQSLEVNAQLTQIEGEVEQVKGQMAYLRDRAAFSTITLQISPQLRTPEPTPTPTPAPWSAGQTFNKATGVTGQVAQSLFQFAVDLVIWAVVVILPFALPVIGLVWIGSRLVRRAGVSAGRQ